MEMEVREPPWGREPEPARERERELEEAEDWNRVSVGVVTIVTVVI